jgi:hypothetical protein
LYPVILIKCNLSGKEMLDKFELEEHVVGSHHFLGIFPREKMEEKGLDSYCL